jgi:hypothetical protein
MTEQGAINHGSKDKEENDAVLRKFRKSLSQSGSGGGVSLHFDADLASELKLNPDTEVEVDVVEEDGDITLEIRDIPAGFTREALKEYAEHVGWEETDSYLSEEEWSLTYRDQSGLVRIEVDSTTRINGDMVNNLFIQGEPIELDGDIERYKDLCMAANGTSLRVRVRDSEGLWQRLQSSSEHDTDDAPDEETFQQLMNASDTVSVQLVTEMASLQATLEEVSNAVEQIRDAMKQYEDLTSTAA